MPAAPIPPAPPVTIDDAILDAAHASDGRLFAVEQVGAANVCLAADE